VPPVRLTLPPTGYPQEWLPKPSKDAPAEPLVEPIAAHEPLRTSLVPAFVAADALGATVDWAALDVAADLVPLTMLLSWAGGVVRPWYTRIDVDVAGTTALLTEGRAWDPARLPAHSALYEHLVTLVRRFSLSRVLVPCLTVPFLRITSA
jgi:hypothetical protein